MPTTQVLTKRYQIYLSLGLLFLVILPIVDYLIIGYQSQNQPLHEPSFNYVTPGPTLFELALLFLPIIGLFFLFLAGDTKRTIKRLPSSPEAVQAPSDALSGTVKAFYSIIRVASITLISVVLFYFLWLFAAILFYGGI